MGPHYKPLRTSRIRYLLQIIALFFEVNSLAWAPWEYGLRLAACSSDGCISILTRNPDDTWDNVEKFPAHDLGVNSVSWAPIMNYQDLSVV